MQTDAYLSNSKFSIAVLAPSDNAADTCSSCNPFLNSTVSIVCLVESRRASAFVWSHKQARLASGFGAGGKAGFALFQKETCTRVGKLQLYLALQFWIWVSTQPFFLCMETVPILDVVTFESTA